jgi:hypothetical protein
MARMRRESVRTKEKGRVKVCDEVGGEGKRKSEEEEEEEEEYKTD